MKRFVLPVIAAAVLGLAPAASAQVSGGTGDTHTHDEDGLAGTGTGAPGTGRTPRTERIPGTGRTPRTERIPGTPRTERIPGTPRTERTPRVGDDDVRRLPRTGSPVTTIAMDGLTLLGAGFVLLRARRRLHTA